MHFPSTDEKMVRQFKSTVDYLLQTQESPGYWGKLGSGDLERSPRVLSLLSWWLNATTHPGYVDQPTSDAADLYVTYLVSHGVSRPGDRYGVGMQTITSGMAGIAVAEWLSFGASFGVPCASCAMSQPVALKSDDDDDHLATELPRFLGIAYAGINLNDSARHNIIKMAGVLPQAWTGSFHGKPPKTVWRPPNASAGTADLLNATMSMPIGLRGIKANLVIAVASSCVSYEGFLM